MCYEFQVCFLIFDVIVIYLIVVPISVGTLLAHCHSKKMKLNPQMKVPSLLNPGYLVSCLIPMKRYFQFMAFRFVIDKTVIYIECITTWLLNLQVFLKQGPYGHYVQVGEDKRGLFPKRASLSEVTITLFFLNEKETHNQQFSVLFRNSIQLLLNSCFRSKI